MKRCGSRGPRLSFATPAQHALGQAVPVLGVDEAHAQSLAVPAQTLLHLVQIEFTRARPARQPSRRTCPSSQFVSGTSRLVGKPDPKGGGRDPGGLGVIEALKRQLREVDPVEVDRAVTALSDGRI